jgi:branched-chain amino acid transport system substrate-binding protein
VFIPSVQAATFAKQFVERGLDKAGIALIGPGDLTDDEALPNMGDVMLGVVTAHFYSATHPSALNRTFVDAYGKETNDRANFMAVSGYDGMHLIYEALKKTGGSTDGPTLISAMKGAAWKARAARCPSIRSPATSSKIYIYSQSREGGWGTTQCGICTFNNVRVPRVGTK